MIWARLALALLAAVGAWGAWTLYRPAQLVLGPAILTLVLWPLLYFALFDRAGRVLARNRDLLRGHLEQAQWVTLAAFVLAVLAVEGLVFATLGEPRTTTGAVREKLLRFDRFRHPDRWRVVLNGEDYFHIPYSEGMKIEKGHAVSFTHRDAWLGVRIVTSYDLRR